MLKIFSFFSFVKRKLKQLFTFDVFSVFISIVISALIEVFRQILVGAFDKKCGEDNILYKKDVLDIIFSPEIANICLITILVWCVTGFCRMISNKRARRPVILTVSVFLGFIASVCWYVMEFIFSNSAKITFILFAFLFLVLLIYFSERGSDSDDRTDYCVAAKPKKK